MIKRHGITVIMMTDEGHFLLRSIANHLSCGSVTEASRLLLEREAGKFDPHLEGNAGKMPKREVALSLDLKSQRTLKALAIKKGNISQSATFEILVRENAIRLQTSKQLWAKKMVAKKIPAGTPSPIKSANRYPNVLKRGMERRLEEQAVGRGEE